MKVCFLLQRQFAYVGHSLALWLKEKYGVNEFCGYVYLRSSYDFLKSQQDINYSALVLDEDVHKEYLKEKVDLQYLARLEKEYGMPNLWPYIALDRVIMFNQMVREYPYNTSRYSHEEMMRIFQVKARAIISFLEKERPDAMLFPNIGGVGALLFYRACKKMGIKTWLPLPACTEGRYLLSEKYDFFTDVEKLIKKYELRKPKEAFEKAEKKLSEFRKKPTPYYTGFAEAQKTMRRAHQLKFLKPKNLLQSLTWFIKLCMHYLNERKNNDYSFNMHPLYYIIDRIKRKGRNLIGAGDLWDKYEPGENFVFFPLHLEPEVALLLNAPFYTDQINLIRVIARSLPLHFKLYVKEHPLMVGYRPRRFYKEIKKNPNVKLIDPAISGLDVVSKAKIITTINSTAGWEGTMLKKPVIIFGDQFYNVLSMVKRCRKIEQLPYLIENRLERFEYKEEELLCLLAAIFEDSIPLDLPKLWEREFDHAKRKAGLEPLADLLAKKLGLNRQL